MINQIKKGTVVAKKLDKTATVVVEQVKTHPLYKKKFTVTKKYKVHDETNKSQPGDLVEIIGTRPISKDKHFKIKSIIK